MEFVLEILVWLVAEVVCEAVGWMLAPAWRVFVRMLNGPAVLLLWGAALASMHQAWRMDARGDASSWIPIALFILPPSFMMVASLSWRDRDTGLPRRPRRQSAH